MSSSVEKPETTPLATAEPFGGAPFQHSSRRARLDDQGRLLPRTEAERAEDIEAVRAWMAAPDVFPDDPHGSDEAFWRAIDENRPERPLFRHLYEPGA